MEIKVTGDTKEIIIDQSEKVIIKKADDELKHLNGEDKALIEDILSYNHMNRDFSKSNPQLNQQIARSLEVVLTSESTLFILNTIPNTAHINTVIQQLKSEGLIHDNTANLLKVLSAKYGIILQDYIAITKNPKQWNRISSDTKISGTALLASKVWRIDGSNFEFDTLLKDGITLANHFVRRTYETIEFVDKELILELDMGTLDELQDEISKLKELRESVESEIVKLDDPTTEIIE